jgi:hypothetical protein
MYSLSSTNSTSVTRVVPKAKENDILACRNFNPVLAWSMGCQMTNIYLHNDYAAATTATRGDVVNIALNAGRFQQAGGCGYIPKPPSLLGEEGKPEGRRLKIRILSGSCLPRPTVILPSHNKNKNNHQNQAAVVDAKNDSESNFHNNNNNSNNSNNNNNNPRQVSVTLELHDVQTTGHRRNQEKLVVSTHQVKCCRNDDAGSNLDRNGTGGGFAPIFYDRGKDLVVESPHVAMLLFQVVVVDVFAANNDKNNVNDDDDHEDDNHHDMAGGGAGGGVSSSGVMGMAAIPVSCLRRGYRSVQLSHPDGTRYGPYAFATLLVYLQFY